ncbi:arylformamidase [Patiriisocius marinistellae]|uniref:Arylformamidase n=1 Tax=Patiriisocius marinistellae TaxID=2494560 RepID=A0A5J4FWQ0_9FLAO|nr:cyclase family protein [Patiriisocius marinistellae]GEQ84516.1 arylformamidase [Patiriisocius marinistellae]
MKATITLHATRKAIDLSKPIDLSITLKNSDKNPLAWYLEKPKISPVQLDDWVGSVEAGASVNFNNIAFNPHAHGTHTECYGHITKEFYSINDALKTFFFMAEVITVAPENREGDLVISEAQLKERLHGTTPQAVVIRTLPNTISKKSRKYSNTNWAYLHKDAATYLRKIGVLHLLIDLPSIDKEKDDGALLAHKAFWDVPKAPRKKATITEFIYVPNSVKDGSYVLNLQIASFENDASPSKPILYKPL